jgi:hypothetical protein
MATTPATPHTAPTARHAQAPAWAPCPTCWGQRSIWTRDQAANGEGAILVASGCWECLAIGEVLR